LVEGVRAQEVEAQAKRQAAETSRRATPTESRSDLPSLPATTVPTTESLWERMLQRWTAPRDRASEADAPRGANPFLPAATASPPQSSVTGTTPLVPAGPSAPSAEAPAPPRLADAVPEAEVEVLQREPHRPPAPDRERERYYRQLPKKF
jgi:hypothetical protein